MGAATGQKLLPVLWDVVMPKFVGDSEPFARGAGNVSGIEIAENHPARIAENEHPVELAGTIALVNDWDVLRLADSCRADTALTGILVGNIAAQLKDFSFA